MEHEPDVAIIGAGPSGAVAAALLVRSGHRVTVVERNTFPRFSIGQSLLPQCMVFLEEAGLLQSVKDAGFQFKDGADFSWGVRTARIHFPEKSTPGPGTAFQVERGRFDKLLIDKAAAIGADVRFQHTVTGFADEGTHARLDLNGPQGPASIRARFVLDASGFGRVLPRLLELDRPTDQLCRRVVFKHLQQPTWKADFDRCKILIAIHPLHQDVWYWVIPLNDGVVSIGVIGPDAKVLAAGGTPEERYRHFTDGMGWEDWFDEATEPRPAAEICGYATSVSTLFGDRFALLGNAGEFIDPIFSSGVTIALKSASLAAAVLHRQLQGEVVDWQTEYSDPLLVGVDAFRAGVNAWYDGSLQRIIFSNQRGDNDVTRHLTAFLAGYAWDTNNPFVRKTERFIQVVDHLVRRDSNGE